MARPLRSILLHPLKPAELHSRHHANLTNPCTLLQVSLINFTASLLGAGGIQAFRTMRTLRALRPLRAMSRMQGMRVCTHNHNKQQSHDNLNILRVKRRC